MRDSEPEKETPDIAIPMVSFCDIPLSEITDHAENYGSYGIGLSKEWAIGKGINPVFYVKTKSRPLTALLDLIDTVVASISNKSNPTADENKILNSILYIGLYTKRYEGRLFRGASLKKVRFYNEREWRFVPDLTALEKRNMRSSITWEQFQEKEELFYSWNDTLSKEFKLGFTPDDIKYIIVKSESEVLDMARKVKEIKSPFSEEQKDILVTRIISMEQIDSDF